MIADIAVQLVEPPALVQEVKKRKGAGRRTRRNTAIVIGTILILSDGSECVVTHFDKNGDPWCVPR